MLTAGGHARSSQAVDQRPGQLSHDRRARVEAAVSDDGALGEAVDAVIAAQPDVAEKIRAGKVQASGALIGAVMKAMRGQADAARVRELILERLA